MTSSHSPWSHSLEMPEGKQRLIAAALRVAARDGLPLHALGLRELAREAGLNHNTFYRHFSDLASLAQEIAALITHDLVESMRRIRMQSERHRDATVGVVTYYSQVVLQHQDAFVVGVQELANLRSPIRPVIQAVLRQLAEESVLQIRQAGFAPGVGDAPLKEAALEVCTMMFNRSLDLIEGICPPDDWAQELIYAVRRLLVGQLALDTAAQMI